jgi:hypothetical protein
MALSSYLINSLARPNGSLKSGQRPSVASPATRSHASWRQLRPPAYERLCADWGGPSTTERLRADANERPEGLPRAE